MIRLEKGPEPQILTDNGPQWTAELMAHVAAGNTPPRSVSERYRHAQIKQALIEETAGKCAYCEAKLRHVAHGDIEHIHPKSRDRERTFLWSNLTLGCELCNQNKGAIEGIIDPYIEDPAHHFVFAGTMVFGSPTSEIGLLSERALKLNRGELVERREERLKYLRALFVNYANTTDNGLRALLLDDIRDNECMADKEFAAMSRQFVSQVLEKMREVSEAAE